MANGHQSEPSEAPQTDMTMYHALASWWPLLSAPADYAEEAEFYRAALVNACETMPKTMLELGSGGGNNASHLKTHFQLTLVDLSEEMLAVSRNLNPECEHVAGDMRTVRLGREFDCVFVHDAVVYMTNETDLRAAIDTAWVHCAPGGGVLFAPDDTRETFRPSTSHGGHDGDERSMRYLEWTWDPDPPDSTYVVDYVFLLRTSDGPMTVEHDRHVDGLFARADWLRLMTDVGFDAVVLGLEHSEAPGKRHDVFVGTKRRSAGKTS